MMNPKRHYIGSFRGFDIEKEKPPYNLCKIHEVLPSLSTLISSYLIGINMSNCKVTHNMNVCKTQILLKKKTAQNPINK